MQAFDDQALAPPQFRLSAKNLFLTYPHCGLELTDVRDILIPVLGRGNVVYMVLAREEHEDGTPHVHVFVALSARCNIRDPNALDLYDFHGNYQSVRNAKATIRYVKKDGNFIEYGECPASMMDSDSRQNLLDRVSRITNEADLCSFIFMNELSREYNVLLRYWQNLQSGRAQSLAYTLDQFRPPVELVNALDELPQSRCALVLVGATGIGKIQYLLTRYPNSLRCTHMDDLKRVTPSTELIILDDMEFGHYPRATLLHLFDVRTDRSIHCRHSNARLNSSVNLVLVCNAIDLALGSHSSDPAILRRLRVIEINQRLF